MESSRGKAGHAQGEQSPVVCGGETQIEQLILLTFVGGGQAQTHSLLPQKL